MPMTGGAIILWPIDLMNIASLPRTPQLYSKYALSYRKTQVDNFYYSLPFSSMYRSQAVGFSA